MLRSMQDLENYAISAVDGTIGHVQDLYFEDSTWVVRYLVIDTGSWLSSRKVLLSPLAVGHPDWAGRVLPVSITREQVKDSPEIDTEKPVSRQHEKQYLDYYGFPLYWGGAGFWGSGSYPAAMLGIGSGGVSVEDSLHQGQAIQAERESVPKPDGDPHLRSCRALMKYRVEATDGGVGRVHGVLLDEETWAIRYLVVETGSWWHGHQVLIAPKWIRDIRWLDTTVSVSLSRQAVKNAPPYDPGVPLSRQEETLLYEHHGRSGYWAEDENVDHAQHHVAGTSPAPRGLGADRL